MGTSAQHEGNFGTGTLGALGALITGPTEADKNLGIHAEACSSEPVACSQFDSPELITIDTSVAGTHTILFSATNQSGNTGYATRIVNVSAEGGSASGGNVLSPLSIAADIASTTPPADSATVSDAAAATTTTAAATTE